jgi:methylenetetrahydrofolate dehydrogenase (NADP+)/methenyltetrahydrofolate cyclohydrolase
MALVLDGKAIAATVRREVGEEVDRFRQRHGRAPSLHVVLVGDDPASAVYVRNKENAAREVGISGEVHRLPKETTEADVVALVDRLNADDSIDGILVQLPMPPAVREQVVLDRIDPRKDVDGLHPTNAGLLASGRPGLVPCTPLGCMRLLDEALASPALASPARPSPPRELAGAHAVVVGRSNLVGKPIAQLLLARHATVTVAHSRTRDLAAVCRDADVLVVAVGRPALVTEVHVREGAIVIDVGINRVEAAGKARLVGDVAYDRVAPKTSAITPVPGGVGPMTIAFLLRNTVRAAELRT